MNEDIYLPSFEIFMRESKTAKACSDLTFITASLSGTILKKNNNKQVNCVQNKILLYIAV